MEIERLKRMIFRGRNVVFLVFKVGREGGVWGCWVWEWGWGLGIRKVIGKYGFGY